MAQIERKRVQFTKISKRLIFIPLKDNVELKIERNICENWSWKNSFSPGPK